MKKVMTISYDSNYAPLQYPPSKNLYVSEIKVAGGKWVTFTIWDDRKGLESFMEGYHPKHFKQWRIARYRRVEEI